MPPGVLLFFSLIFWAECTLLVATKNVPDLAPPLLSGGVSIFSIFFSLKSMIMGIFVCMYAVPGTLGSQKRSMDLAWTGVSEGCDLSRGYRRLNEDPVQE